MRGKAWRSRAAAAALGLLVVSGCGASTPKAAPQEEQQQLPVTSTTKRVTTTTRARATTTVAPTTVAPTTVPPTLPPVTRPRYTAPPRTVPPPPPPPPPPSPLAPIAASVPQSGAEGALVAGINNFRAAHGLPPLAVHSNLVSKARAWAAHMANGGCGRGGGGTPNICHSVLSNGIAVRWTRLAENVGMISPMTNVSGMEGGFEGSPPHAANMLNNQMQYVGVGAAYVGNYMYVAEEFMAT
jgi:uncharacterized protein YkwD